MHGVKADTRKARMAATYRAQRRFNLHRVYWCLLVSVSLFGGAGGEDEAQLGLGQDRGRGRGRGRGTERRTHELRSSTISAAGDRVTSDGVTEKLNKEIDALLASPGRPVPYGGPLDTAGLDNPARLGPIAPGSDGAVAETLMNGEWRAMDTGGGADDAGLRTMPAPGELRSTGGKACPTDDPHGEHGPVSQDCASANHGNTGEVYHWGDRGGPPVDREHALAVEHNDFPASAPGVRDGRAWSAEFARRAGDNCVGAGCAQRGGRHGGRSRHGGGRGGQGGSGGGGGSGRGGSGDSDSGLDDGGSDASRDGGSGSRSAWSVSGSKRVAHSSVAMRSRAVADTVLDRRADVSAQEQFRDLVRNLRRAIRCETHGPCRCHDNSRGRGDAGGGVTAAAAASEAGECERGYSRPLHVISFLHTIPHTCCLLLYNPALYSRHTMIYLQPVPKMRGPTRVFVGLYTSVSPPFHLPLTHA